MVNTLPDKTGFHTTGKAPFQSEENERLHSVVVFLDQERHESRVNFLGSFSRIRLVETLNRDEILSSEQFSKEKEIVNDTKSS